MIVKRSNGILQKPDDEFPCNLDDVNNLIKKISDEMSNK